MKNLTEDEFLEWARSVGLDLDARRPQSRLLSFLSGQDARYYWPLPRDCYRRPHACWHLLQLLGDWRTCYVWRHLGSWPSEQYLDRLDPSELLEYQVLEGLGVPLDTASVLAFEREDVASLLTLMFISTQCGWSVGQDIHVVPDHARQFLVVSHHDRIDAHFHDQGDVADWTRYMLERDLGEPVSLPE